MKKVMIMNAVPTNNGDAALVLGLYGKLKERGYDVVISTMKIDIVKKLYPSIKWIKAEYEYTKLEYRLSKVLPYKRESILEKRIRRNHKHYNDVDIIISAPGGYINSYYGIYDRLYCMDIIKKKYNPKMIMYSQSIGPLNIKDREILDKYINTFDLFMARDEISYNNIKEYKNAIRTNDAAFLLEPIRSPKDRSMRVAISVREWAHDGRKKEHYIKLIEKLVCKCIDYGYEVEFISTCQGINGYVDDSLIAEEIKSKMKDEYKDKIVINKQYHSLESLRKYIQRFKFVIGTRLHMCILSILSGIPAFNISYEVKGKECYKILDLSRYSIDYNDDIELALSKLEEFIRDNNELCKLYEIKACEMHEEAEKYFNFAVENISER